MEAAMLGAQANSRKRRRGRHTDAENRTVRALQLTHMGELSSARQALEASPVAPVNESTRVKLTEKNRRPSRPRRSLDAHIATAVPSVPVDLDIDKFHHNLRTVRRGAAGGPSGMNGEHLKTVLESPSCLGLLSEVAAQFARAEISVDILKAIRLGRMTALQKPDGGVRGIVVGDVFRRLFAREPCPTGLEGGRGRNPPVPVFALHESRDGVCHPHRSGVDK